MKTTEIKSGGLIYQKGRPVNEIALVKSGTVSVTTSSGTYTVEERGILGICELASAIHYYSYRAASPVIIERYEYNKTDLDFFSDKIPELAEYAVSSGVEQIGNISASYMMSCMNIAEIYDFINAQYSDYCSLCGKMHLKPKALGNFDEIERPDSSKSRIHHMSGFYSIVRQITEGNIFSAQSDFVDGFVRHLSFDSEQIFRTESELDITRKDMMSLLIGEDGDDLLECYAGLIRNLKHESSEASQIADAVTAIRIELNSHKGVDPGLEKTRVGEVESALLKLPAKVSDSSRDDETDDSYDKDMLYDPSELSDSIDTILDYADCGDEVNSSFKAAVSAYKLLSDRDSMDDIVSKLRHTISRLFYQVYMQAFQVSIGGVGIPLAVKMFLNFGYVDEELAGEENAAFMANLVTQGFDAPEYQIFTLYDWLLAIYHGERMPSRNEFDQDFTDSVHAKKMKGEIDKDTEQRLLSDRAQMVVFELKNMFPSADKMTFGRITLFKGIFADNDVVGGLSHSLVTVSDLQAIIQDVRERDFTVFHRETIYSDPDVGINKDFIHPEIIPDIILMPNVGTRGVMWQEIEGKKRLSEGRIMLPVFLLEELKPVVIHTIGEFRWELCKRMQGSFWNDITDPSLTSEYFDYVQFYKKNQDLSQEMKDKIKISLMKAKNSYKEMFVRDYITWIMFESEGLPRLNKVSRSIMFKYCPFNKDIREGLSKNPLYENALRYYTLHNGQKKHHFSNVTREITNLGKEVPDEIKTEIEYLDM